MKKEIELMHNIKHDRRIMEQADNKAYNHFLKLISPHLSNNNPDEIQKILNPALENSTYALI